METQDPSIFEKASFGIEFTRVPDNEILYSLEDECGRIVASGNSKLSNNIRKFIPAAEKDLDFKKHVHRASISLEDGAIELPSKPMKTLQQLKEFYAFTERFSASFGERVGAKFVPYTEKHDYHIEGGGEHVHVKIENRFNVYYAVKNCLAAPQIRWFMADWVDEDSSPKRLVESICPGNAANLTSLVANHLCNFGNAWGITPVQPRVRTIMNRCTDKAHNNTIEFRFLQSATSLQHMIDNVELSIRLCYREAYSSVAAHYCLEKSDCYYTTNFENYAKAPAAVHLKDFKLALEYLGFEESRIKHFVKEYSHNYKMRRKYGKLN